MNLIISIYFQKIGVTDQEIEEYETGKEIPPTLPLHKIQKLLGIIFSYFRDLFINRSIQNEVALFNWAVHFLRFCLFIIDRTSDFCGEQGKK